MDNKLNKIDERLDKLTESVHSIDKTLARQEENLKEHMRRSEANEKAVELLSIELKPIKTHVNRIDGALKLIGLIAVAIGIATGLINLIEFINSQI